jgi:hypothetical protein
MPTKMTGQGDYAHGDDGTRGLRPRRRRDKGTTPTETTGQGDYAHKDNKTKGGLRPQRQRDRSSECTSSQDERQDVYAVS